EELHRAGGHASPLPGDGALHPQQIGHRHEAEAETDEQHGQHDLRTAGGGSGADEQQRAGEAQKRAAGRHGAVADLQQHAAGQRRSDRPADQDGGEDGAGVHRRAAEHTLAEDRHVGGDGEEERPEEDVARARHGDQTVAEEVERQHRLRGPALLPEEDGEPRRRAGQQRQCAGIAPAPALRPFDQGEQEEGDRRRQAHRAEDVQPVLRPRFLLAQPALEHPRREEAEGDVEEEDPAPGKDVRDDSAQQRADEAGQRPDSREGSLDAPAFLQLVDVADDGDGHRHHAARAETLDGAEDHQLHERAREAGERRDDEEERHRHLVGALAAVEVGELAEKRHRGGGGQQVDGEDPTVAGNPAELAHRRRHRRGHGRRLQRGEEHAEQDAGGDQSAFSSRLQGDSFEASRFAGRRSGILYVPLFGARERRAYTPPREETMSQRALLLVFVPLLVLGTVAVALGQHEHGTPPQAAAAAGGDGTILDVPAVDIGAQTLAARERAQRSTVEKFRVPIDFRFTERLAESGITFVHQIVDDAGKTYKPAHYDHGNGIAAADVDGDGLVDLYFTSQMGGNELWRNLGGGKFR